MVSEALPGAVWLVGLTVHTGGLAVVGPEDTAHASPTGFVKVPVDEAAITTVPIAEPPGSTAGRSNPVGMLIEN